MYALQRAGRRTPLLRIVFSIKVGHRVVLERYSRITSLLGAPVNQAFFTDVQVTRSGATTPLVRFAFRDAVLKPVEARMVFIAKFLYLLEDVLLFCGKRLERTVTVVNHAHR